MLPQDYKSFKEENYGKGGTFIVKPEDSCQGKGIFLLKNLDLLKPTDNYVV